MQDSCDQTDPENNNAAVQTEADQEDQDLKNDKVQGKAVHAVMPTIQNSSSETPPFDDSPPLQSGIAEALLDNWVAYDRIREIQATFPRKIKLIKRMSTFSSEEVIIGLCHSSRDY